MRFVFLLTMILLPTVALAQMPEPQVPSAVQRCGNVVGALEVENATISQKLDELQITLRTALARAKELEDKYEPKNGEKDK